MPLGLKSQVNVKKHNFGEANMSISLLSNNEGKSGNKESDRRLNHCSYSKRPRIDQSESHATNVRVDDVIFQKNTDSMRSASTDKARMIRPKRILDAKRNDRKNFRSGIKARFDTFTSKVGFAGTDSTCGGNNLLGIHGLKSDLCDVTKNMDEPGLTELLDGSYHYSNTNVEKGKKHSVVSENMIVSVRNAFSILPHNGAADCHHSNEDKKTTICLTNPSSSSSMPDCHHNIKEVAESSSATKYPNLADVDLCQPKKVLECLALPPHNLDALLSDLSLTSCVLKTTLSKETCNSASLPPFSWSISHSGAYKPIADSGRQVSAKNACQSKWLKIDRNSVLAGGIQHCFSDLELLIFSNNEDSLKRSNVIRNDHLESSFKCHEPSGQVFPMSTSVETNILDDTKLETKSCISVSLISKRLDLMEEQTNSSLTRPECDSKDDFLPRTSVTECNLKLQGKDSHLLDQGRSTPQFSNTEDPGKDLHDMRTLNKHVCSSVCCCAPSKDLARENGKSLKFSTLDASTPVYSSREIHAAEILLDISRSCKILKPRRQDVGGIKLSEVLSQKSVKSQKSISIMERSESSLFRTRNTDPFRTIPLPQWEHKSGDKRKDISYMRNSGRVPMKYSARLESGVPPLKLEKDLLVGARSLHNVTVRSMGLIASAARVENGHDTQQKLRKTSVTTSIVGSCIKDWGRGRNKQE